MGKFANEPEGGTMWVGPPVRNQPWHGQSEFDAMGHEVPMFRKAAAERHMKDMGFTNAEQRFDVVNGMANAIQRDNSHEALELAMRKGVDATGCYRLLSVLLCEPEPKEEPVLDQEPATYLDLVGAKA